MPRVRSLCVTRGIANATWHCQCHVLVPLSDVIVLITI